jgi:hypothetical protein
MGGAQVSCRDYRESVLGAMPHRWSRLSDTRFELLHFVKHRHGKGARKRELGETSQHGGKAVPDAIGKDHSNLVASAVGKLAEV